MSVEKFVWNAALAHQILPRQAQEQIRFGIYKSYAEVLQGTLKHLGRLNVDRDLPGINFESYKAGMQAGLATEEQLLIPSYKSHDIRPRLSLHRVDVDQGLADERTAVLVMYTNKLHDSENVITSGFTELQAQVLLDHITELDDAGLRPTFVTQ